ncbi:HU family DNA-binding protein [Treponema sp.]|uniref:HU family DNA-binding protein n=1 Tax=Treponema sp. TaxID=166 RepID=UPI003FD89D81
MLYTTTQRENPLDRSQKKFYAAPSYTEDVTLRKVAQDISKTCTLTPADISAVLESFLDILPGYLEEGHSIKMGDFGRFRLSFSSLGHELEKDVSATDIKNARILFVPSSELKIRLDSISYSKR